MDEGIRFPFPSLRSLELLERTPPNCDIMASLQSAPLLESLSLVWRSQWPFPAIEGMPNLRTLRLTVYSVGISSSEQLTSPQLSISSLTTLHMACVHDDLNWETFLGHKFPNLSVLNVQNISARPWKIFDFIHSHPSLLEVNLSFIYGTTIRLEAILKLIDGTGVWRAPNGETVFHNSGSSFYIAPGGTKVYLDVIEINFWSPRTFQDDIPNSRYATRSFAFKRVPLNPLTMKPPPSQELNARQPKYQAKEFAIMLANQHKLEARGHPFGHFHQFFALAHLFPAVEVLRVRSRTAIPVNYGFFDYLVSSLILFLRIISQVII